jgi:Tfp pilus assembly protein PilO
MSGRARLILTGVAAFLVLLLFFFFFIRPARSELAELTLQADAEEATTQSLQVELQRLEALRDNAPQLRAELEEIRGFVPQRHQIPNLIFQVQDAADAAGVSFLDVTPELPAPPPEDASVAQVGVSIGAEGGYFAIQDFIRRLYNLDRALRIDVLDLAETGEGDDLTLTISTRVFFELPGEVAPAAAVPADEEPVEEPAG